MNTQYNGITIGCQYKNIQKDMIYEKKWLNLWAITATYESQQSMPANTAALCRVSRSELEKQLLGSLRLLKI